MNDTKLLALCSEVDTEIANRKQHGDLVGNIKAAIHYAILFFSHGQHLSTALRQRVEQDELSERVFAEWQARLWKAVRRVQSNPNYGMETVLQIAEKQLNDYHERLEAEQQAFDRGLEEAAKVADKEAARQHANEKHESIRTFRYHYFAGGQASALEIAAAIRSHIGTAVQSHPATVDDVERARQLVIVFMNDADAGDGDYSCNECELDCYLCPHLFNKLRGRIAASYEQVRADQI